MAGKAVISLTTGLEDPEKVTVAFLVGVGAAASAVAGARTIPGHAPGPFGRKEPEQEVRRELVDTTAGARRGDRHGVVTGRRHRGAD